MTAVNLTNGQSQNNQNPADTLDNQNPADTLDSQNPVDSLNNNFPAETLSENELERRDELAEAMTSNSQTGKRYTDQEVAGIYGSIFRDKLTDKEVAEKHGCNPKYSWNIRRGLVRRELLKKLQELYIMNGSDDATDQSERDTSALSA